MLAAVYAGLSGALLGIFQSFMPPGAFSVDTSGQLVFQTVIGGVGTLLGPTVGAAVWLFLRDELQRIPGVGSLWMFILGAIFVLLVTVLRRGLYGSLAGLWESRDAAAPAPQLRPAAMEGSENTIPPTQRSAVGAEVPLALEARSVSKRYGGLRAVYEASLAVQSGEIYAVIGPNGAGKSTFLRILAGEEAPTAGQVLLRGQDVTGRYPL